MSVPIDFRKPLTDFKNLSESLIIKLRTQIGRSNDLFFCGFSQVHHTLERTDVRTLDATARGRIV